MSKRWVILLGTVLLAAAPSLGAEPQKLKAPDDASIARVDSQLKQVYKQEFTRTTPVERRAFAKKLFELGHDTKSEPAARFVLLREAGNLAAAGGDVVLALHAVDELANTFAIDPGPYKNSVLMIAARTIDDMAQAIRFLGEGVPQIDQFLVAQDFASASKLANTLQSVAIQTHNRAIIDGIRARVAQVKDTQVEFDKLKLAMNRPGKSDPAGETASGKFACFFKDDWQYGLARLANSPDRKIKEAALKDLANPKLAPDQLILANAWWDAAQGQTAFAKTKFEARARYWFQQALPQLNGLEKALAEKRIASSLGAPDDAMVFEGHAYVVQETKVGWHEAKLLCELARGHLACIESAEEEKFCYALSKPRQVLIGGTDEAQEGTWRWVNGSPFEYTNWWPGQPDNAAGAENWLTLERNGRWNDWNIGPTSGGFLCEWE